MTPYDAPMVARMLASASDDDLARYTNRDFQRWPATVILKGELIREMIANEISRRQRCQKS